MQKQDDRTEEQTYTHDNIVAGLDKCMSGWGGAEGGKSYAGWACRAQDVDAVTRWVKSRGDIKRVAVHSHCWAPRGPGHYHIYVVNDGHPALTECAKSHAVTLTKTDGALRYWIESLGVWGGPDGATRYDPQRAKLEASRLRKGIARRYSGATVAAVNLA